jgi:ariadne-1
MVCALPWKTCNCPWFDYSHIPDDDRMNDTRVPYSRHDNGVEVIEITEEPAAPVTRRSSTRTSNRTRHRSERERPQQGTLAAHLQSQRHLHLPNIAASSLNRGDTANVEAYGFGNTGGHHMNDSYQVRPPVITSAAHRPVQSPPRSSYFTSRRVVREAPAPVPLARHVPAPIEAPSSAMAGLSLDGTKRGANRVGTWLSHVKIDPEATNTQAEGVEVDDWRCDGTMIGID